MNMKANRDTEVRRYGQWAGNPKGEEEDPTRCVKEVWPSDGWTPYQCPRKRGHGPDGLYCKQHAKRFEPAANP
jgi:hypothetical protein